SISPASATLTLPSNQFAWRTRPAATDALAAGHLWRHCACSDCSNLRHSTRAMKPCRHAVLITRRDFVCTTSALAASMLASGLSSVAQAVEIPAPSRLAGSNQPHPLLTPADKFRDVSRGNPKPHTLTGDALVRAGLTPETWRLEITAD